MTASKSITIEAAARMPDINLKFQQAIYGIKQPSAS